MNDRREFLRRAGFLSTVSWSMPRLAHGYPTTPAQSVPDAVQPEHGSIVLENAEIRLAINPNGSAQSLIHKPSGQECLTVGTNVPMFTVTQNRPYDNELQLAYPAKATSFPVESVRREGELLIVTFAQVGYEAEISVKITDTYLRFRLESFEYKGFTKLTKKRKTEIDEALLVQLAIRKRKHLGEWLNVMWDDDVAVNLLATDPHVRVDAVPCTEYSLFQAGVVSGIQLAPAGAALIVTKPELLLDRIARVEEDFNLPRGVQSRRSNEYRYSYYEASNLNPQNVDRHVRFAKQAGFRAMDVSYRSFAATAGHFPWRPEYPNEFEDLKTVVKKVKDAGIIPGIHIHYNKADKEDLYVTPKPDPRLNLSERFTLAESISATAATVPVEEDPQRCTLEEGRRILKIQNELVTFERYTTTAPFRFEGCKRGALGTTAAAHDTSSWVGLLDVDTWPIFVRFTQNTSIQEEVAAHLGKLYHDGGFQFVYYDGAEDVPEPYWYTVSRAQYVVHQQLDPKPLFAEGACKSHFGWHILTRGNAFDIFLPEVMKEATREYAAAEAPGAANDFTSINFGWIGYWSPGPKTMGTQPDMLEYVTSRAAGWDCPIALMGELEALEAHPRTTDNLDVIRRWEDARAAGWLTADQKVQLRNLQQEHILIINEQGRFELCPYDQIECAGARDGPARAFLFERNGESHVVYWHTSGEGILDLPLEARQIRLMKELGKPQIVKGNADSVELPLGERRYIGCGSASRQQVTNAFRRARILSR